jgi:hypothetical protein
MFDLKPKTLYNQYRNGLSDYKIDIENGKWGNKKVEIIDFETGEILKSKTVYIAKRLLVAFFVFKKCLNQISNTFLRASLISSRVELSMFPSFFISRSCESDRT